MAKSGKVRVTVPFRLHRHQVAAFLLTIREAAGVDAADTILDEVVVEGSGDPVSGTEALQAYIDKKWEDDDAAE